MHSTRNVNFHIEKWGGMNMVNLIDTKWSNNNSISPIMNELGSEALDRRVLDRRSGWDNKLPFRVFRWFRGAILKLPEVSRNEFDRRSNQCRQFYQTNPFDHWNGDDGTAILNPEEIRFLLHNG